LKNRNKYLVPKTYTLPGIGFQHKTEGHSGNIKSTSTINR